LAATPGPNDGHVVSNFIVQTLLGHDLTVYGEGLQTRSFCYVDDLIDGPVRLMANPAEITGPINIGNPTEFSIIELAEMVIGVIGSRSRIIRRPLPENDPKQREPDISMAQKLLDWKPHVDSKPHVPLKAGLVKTVEYFENLLADHSLRDQLSNEART
jgi:UDP-glucuronate decarboxylase